MPAKKKETLKDLGKHEEELVQGKALSELNSYPKEEVSAAIATLAKESGKVTRMVANVEKQLHERDVKLALYDRAEKEVEAIANTKNSPLYLLDQAIEQLTQKAKKLSRTIDGGKVTKVPPNSEIWGAIEALKTERSALALLAKQAACTTGGYAYEECAQTYEDNESLWDEYKSTKEDE